MRINCLTDKIVIRAKMNMMHKIWTTNEQTNKEARWFLRPDCDPSSECPQFADLWLESAEWCGCNISGSAHLCRQLPLHAATPPVLPLHAMIGGRLPEWQTSKCISSVSFVIVRIESEFFLRYTGDTDAKKDGPEFWNSNSVIFENFFNFHKRRRVVTLQQIWTIMVAAKLDYSRVLVTKFRQTRSKLKGRSASQRHTDTHTHKQTDKLGWK